MHSLHALILTSNRYGPPNGPPPRLVVVVVAGVVTTLSPSFSPLVISVLVPSLRPVCTSTSLVVLPSALVTCTEWPAPLGSSALFGTSSTPSCLAVVIDRLAVMPILTRVSLSGKLTCTAYVTTPLLVAADGAI